MAIFAPSKIRRPSLAVASQSKEVLGPPLISFLGCHNSANKVNQPFGQLLANKNMEYMRSGDNVYLKTKRGSTLITDIALRPYGAGMYVYDRTDEYFVWVDGTNIKHCDTDGSNVTTLLAGLTANTQAHFVMYGQDTNATLYGCNGTTDDVFKVSGSTPSFASVSSSPQLSHIAFATLVGKLFGVYGHTVYWSKTQTGSGVSNLEDWDLGTNDATVSPDSGEGFNFVLDLGINGIYFFKDTGIWVLLNANETTQSDWRFPRCNADVGTQSPKTVHAVNYMGMAGIIYLAADKTLRFFSPELVYNAGSLPSITNSQSKVISEPFQKLLSEIPDGYLSKCTATYYDRYYILNIVSEGSTDIDKTIYIDTEKALPAIGDKLPQPYWFESKNVDFCEFVTRDSNHKLYGFNKNGYISQLLVEDKFYEEMPTRVSVSESYEDSGTTRKVAIEYNAYTAWIDYSRLIASGQELELIRGYMHWETGGNWGLNVLVNASLRGESMPDYDVGLTRALTPNTDTFGGMFDISLFSESYFASASASASQNIRVRNKGHFFIFGIYSTAYNEPVTIFGIDPIFKLQQRGPTGIR